jgi:hypothetical protein
MNRLLATTYRDVVAELPRSVVASSFFLFPAAVYVHKFGITNPHDAFERRLVELGVP